VDGKERKGAALVTGASGGIGLELARVLAREGYDLVLVARSADKLEGLAADLRRRHGTHVLVIPADLSDPSAPQSIYDKVQAERIDVSVLVNNAGFTLFNPFVEIPWEKNAELLAVNIVALTHLTKLFLPGMVERGYGRVLNLASTAAFQPGPLMATYYASKAYVLSFSEALHSELEGTDVTVTALCPGPTASDFQKRGDMESSGLVAGRKLPDARSVARAGYKALMRGQAVAVLGRRNWLYVQSIRLLPRKLIREFVKRAQAPI
jgi:uncharacterized protein